MIETYKNAIQSDFFLSGPVVAFIWNNDDKWSVADLSSNITHFFGYSPSMFLSNELSYSTLIHPDDIKRVQQEVATACEQKATSFNHKPYRIKTFLGEYIWVKDTTTILYNEHNTITHFVGYIISINEEIETIQALNGQLEFESTKLQSLVHAIPDLVWMKDENGVYLACNKRFEDFFGASEKEIVGKTDYDFVPKELADSFRQNDLKAMYASAPTSNFEEIPFASDGHKEYLKTTKTKVLDSNNKLLGVLGIGRDFTYEKKTQEKIEQQKTELQTIFDTTKDGIAVLDLETNFKKVNQAYCDITGLSEEELLQTSCLALSFPEDVPRTLEKMKGLFRDGFVDNYEKRCQINGRMITVAMTVTLLPDKQHMLLSMKDITQIKLFEEQSKLAAMGEMIGNIAHQWRQPLSIITTIASSTQIRFGLGMGDQELINSSMDTIISQSNYLSQTIDDFRNFIKEGAGAEDFRLSTAIEKTISLLTPALKSHNVVFVSEITKDLVLNGYQNELIQALINIINNAKDVLNEHEKMIESKVIVLKTFCEDNRCVVTIQDSGRGIREEYLSRIFEPYFTTKHSSVGTGIGLSMSYKIIHDRHQGSLSVSNEEFVLDGLSLRGACFKISFPFIKEVQRSHESKK